MKYGRLLWKALSSTSIMYPHLAHFCRVETDLEAEIPGFC